MDRMEKQKRVLQRKALRRNIELGIAIKVWV